MLDYSGNMHQIQYYKKHIFDLDPASISALACQETATEATSSAFTANNPSFYNHVDESFALNLNQHLEKRNQFIKI